MLEGFSYAQFVIPGLILMGVINNSFANAASSLFMSRYLGNIVDLLVTPLTPTQFILAYTLAAMLRGLAVGVVVWLISLCFATLPWAHPLLVVAMAVLASFLFAQCGMITALYANSFDSLAMYTNFMLLPLIYLGGVFYPISILPADLGRAVAPQSALLPDRRLPPRPARPGRPLLRHRLRRQRPDGPRPVRLGRPADRPQLPAAQLTKSRGPFNNFGVFTHFSDPFSMMIGIGPVRPLQRPNR